MAIRIITLDIDEAVYQLALTKARTENNTLSQVLEALLAQWAGPVPEPAPAPDIIAGTYTVQPGDTLGAIARDVYGSPAKYTLIAEANQITDPRRIWVGQVLTIPPLPAADETTPVAPLPPTSVPAVPTTAPSPVSPAPDAPPVTWVGSPNFNGRPNPRNIWAIVIHATANRSLEGAITWFSNPSAMVSAHYTIGKDGRIVQHVREEDRAWHAGGSKWKGVPNVNNFALGIELVNLNDGDDPYPELQHEANIELCAYLCRRHAIKPDNIMGHLDVAVPKGRKTDPRGYDLQRLRNEVEAALAD